MRIAVKLVVIAVAMTMASLSFGCDYRWMDPRWKALSEQGASLVPGDYHSVSFLRRTNDEQFAAAVPRLKELRIRNIDVKGQPLTDESITALLQLQDLEELQANATHFTAKGLARLGELPQFTRLYVATKQFDAEEMATLRAAIPEVSENAIFSYDYVTTQPSTRGSDNGASPAVEEIESGASRRIDRAPERAIEVRKR